MYRHALKDLIKWSKNPDHKPLVVKGARQVGKTWLVRHFGEEHYKNTVYVNFDRDSLAKDIFELDYDPKRIISRLSLHARQKIYPSDTLIFLDEIQECPNALESIKYFAEEAPEYHIIVAGSLLGIYLHKDASFPVGKVDFLDIYPLSFTEFLTASGEEGLKDAIEAKDYDLIKPFHDKLIDYYKTYLITGGMPDVVKRYLSTKDFFEVRSAQASIIEAYNRDFSKHAPKNEISRIIEIFDIMPRILAKDNKKFMFGAIRQSARAREYESALLWLIDAGLVTKVNRVNKLALPLSAYSNHDIFKLFYLDVGLLSYKAGLRPEIILEDSNFYEEFKGAMAEQFVFEELTQASIRPYYYSKDDSRTELDFIVDSKTGPTPIEVKSGKALASKSLKELLSNNPRIERAIKASLLPYNENDKIQNLPIYLISTL